MMKPITVGNLVPQYFKSAKKISYHSQFENGFNLACGPYLVFIGEKSVAPFGIKLSHKDFRQLMSGLEWDESTITYVEDRLNIGDYMINLKNSSTDSVSAPPINKSILTNAFLNGFRSYQEGAGLDFFTELNWQQVYNSLYEKDFNKDDTVTFIKNLVGKGPGLTPSGDDFIVGLLAVNESHPVLHKDFYEVLRYFLREGYTTDVSKNYLEAAIEGNFSSSILKTLNDLDQPSLCVSLKTLSNSGSTSGHDTIMGIYWGLNQIKLMNERNDE